MTPETFRDQALALLPARWRGGTIARLMVGIGTMFDALGDAQLAAVKMRFPGFYSDATLSLCGRDRLMFRGLSESDEAYGARLLDWLDVHQANGSPLTTVGQLHAYFTGYDVTVRGIEQLTATTALRYSLDSAGVLTIDVVAWDWDGQGGTLTSRYWILLEIPSELGTMVNAWDTGGWPAHPYIIDVAGMTYEVASQIQTIVRRYNPPHAKCEWIIIVFDTATWEAQLPDGTWDRMSKRNPHVGYFQGTRNG